MIVTLPEEVKQAKQVIDAQYIAGHLSTADYITLHQACDTIGLAFGTTPGHELEAYRDISNISRTDPDRGDGPFQWDRATIVRRSDQPEPRGIES